MRDWATSPRAEGMLAVACGLAYLATGLLFFVDPTQAEEPGSVRYWEVLAEGHPGRLAFVAVFACTGLFALGAVGPIGRLLHPHRRGGLVGWAIALAYLGYAVNTVSYVRLLAGESQRAEAFSAASADGREVLRSFSLVLDPDGWLTFGGVGIFLFVVNLVSWRHGGWPRPLSATGLVAALASWGAMVALVIDHDLLLSLAAGIGGVVLAPLWWIWIGLVLLRADRHPSLPGDQGSDVPEPHGRAEHVAESAEHRR